MRAFLPLVAVALAAVSAALAQPAAVPQTSKVIDRTLLCEAGDTGGIRQVQIAAYPLIHGAGITLTTNLLPASMLGALGRGGLSMSPNCRPAERIPLSLAGLGGGVERFEARYNCVAARRVLVRVRGRFTSPVRLRRGRPYQTPLLYAFAPMKDGELAVRSVSGRPIAYAAFVAGKPARLFLADTCTKIYWR